MVSGESQVVSKENFIQFLYVKFEIIIYYIFFMFLCVLSILVFIFLFLMFLIGKGYKLVYKLYDKEKQSIEEVYIKKDIFVFECLFKEVVLN